MVWLGVGYRNRTNLVFLCGRQNHTDYIQVLHSKLLPYRSELERDHFNTMEFPFIPPQNLKIGTLQIIHRQMPTLKTFWGEGLGFSSPHIVRVAVHRFYHRCR